MVLFCLTKVCIVLKFISVFRFSLDDNDVLMLFKIELWIFCVQCILPMGRMSMANELTECVFFGVLGWGACHSVFTSAWILTA